jgi:dTDP-4-dehydrorhamnose reductase
MTRLPFLITGARGQLAQAFQALFAEQQIAFVALDKSALDITSRDHIHQAFDRYQPQAVINCAAYNLVDDAQKDSRPAFKINAEAVGYLAQACLDVEAALVHFSTDYVFDGQKPEPYTEDDAPRPINHYGQSKFEGETILRSVFDDFLLCRVSWVFGQGQKNFLHKLTTWAKNASTLKIACDEVSVPTFTQDIALVTLKALQKKLKGLYHVTNSGYCTRAQWAKYFFTQQHLSRVIQEVSKSEFDLAAKRPDYSVLSNEKIQRQTGLEIPSWQDAMNRFFGQHVEGQRSES